MSIVFACGQCGKPFNVDDRFAGKKGQCKQCGALMMIPMASLVSPAVARSDEREISPSRRAPKKAPKAASPPRPADAFGFDDAPLKRAAASVLEDEDFSPSLATLPKRASVGDFELPTKRKRKRQGGEESAAMLVFRILLGLAIGSTGTFTAMVMLGTFQALSQLHLSMPSFGNPFGPGLESILLDRIELNKKLSAILATVVDVPSATAASAPANQQLRALAANLRKLQGVKAPVSEVEATGRKHLEEMNAASREVNRELLRIAANPDAFNALNMGDAMTELEAEENKLGMNRGSLSNFRPPAPVMPRMPAPVFNPQPTGPSPPMPGARPNPVNRNRSGGRRPNLRTGFGGPP